MSNVAQIAANMANAQSSTGPRTEEGKQRSSLNALKHGLTASAILIPGEDPAEYEEFKTDQIQDWKPKGAAEMEFVEQLISIQWRLKRCERLEAKILSADEPVFKDLNNISLHAARLKRQFSATFKELGEVQRARLQVEREQREDAAVIRRLDIAEQRDTDFSQFGFDFTVEEIDRYISNIDRLAAASLPLGRPDFPLAA